MRTVKIILVLMVLVGFPAVSWFYLKSGLKWRVNAQDSTVRKEMLTGFALMQTDSAILSTKELTGKYYLMASPQDTASVHHLKMIHKQFHARTDFALLAFIGEDEQLPEKSDTSWNQVQCVQGCDALKTTLFPSPYNAAIVDASLYVRGRYELASMEDMRRLVEHLAVVLPIEKRERIELKRGEQ